MRIHNLFKKSMFVIVPLLIAVFVSSTNSFAESSIQRAHRLMLEQRAEKAAEAEEKRAQARRKAAAKAAQREQMQANAKQRLKEKTVWSQIKRVMKHNNCTNCHKIGTTNGPNSTQNQQVKDRLTGLNHPGAESNSPCETCHNPVNVLSGNPPDAFPGTWDSAPTGQDFSRMSNTQLCNAAKEMVNGHSAQEHLKRDPLILWAIRGGNVPRQNDSGFFRRSPAYSRGINGWRSFIDQWVRYGQKCP